MSHKATAWLADLEPDRLKAGAFRVLFHLCHHHNSTRSPTTACFPSQMTLMTKTGLSNGGLNNCINDLEKQGFLSRRHSTAPGKQTRRTYYILGCDADIDQVATIPRSAVPTVQAIADEQTPLLSAANSTFAMSKLHPTGDEQVSELVRGTGNSPVVPAASFEEFWAIVPKRTAKARARKAWLKATAKVDPEQIFAAMLLFANSRKGQDPKYTAHPATWLNDERWEDDPPPQSPQANHEEFHNKISKNLERISDGKHRANELDFLSTQFLSSSF